MCLRLSDRQREEFFEKSAIASLNRSLSGSAIYVYRKPYSNCNNALQMSLAMGDIKVNALFVV